MYKRQSLKVQINEKETPYFIHKGSTYEVLGNTFKNPLSSTIDVL